MKYPRGLMRVQKRLCIAPAAQPPPLTSSSVQGAKRKETRESVWKDAREAWGKLGAEKKLPAAVHASERGESVPLTCFRVRAHELV